MPNTFLVKAYRNGWHNDKQFVVYCGPDVEAAYGLAAEANDSGKYGLMVVEFGENGEDPIHSDYISSARGEPSLQHNWGTEKYFHCHNLLVKYLRNEISKDQMRDDLAKINGLYMQLEEMEQKFLSCN